MDARTILRINDSMKSDRTLFESLWQDIADYIVFRKSSILGQHQQGEKLTSKMFDSTATVAAEDLAAWIHGQLTEMSMSWFSLTTEGLGDEDPMLIWLENARRLQHKALQESNFASQWLEVLNDLVTFCTGALFMEENDVEAPGFNGLNFISLAPGSYCISNDRDGRTNVLFREIKLSAQRAFDQFGDKVSEKVKKDLDKNPNQEHEYLHAVFPTGWFDGKKGPRPFESYYIDCNDKRIMKRGGYFQFPYAVIPWKRESGEDYGRGPGFTALPDVKTLHKAKELGLKEWAMSIMPPFQVPDNGVVGSVKITPAGLTIVKDTNNGIKPILTNAPYNANRMNLEDIRMQIQQVFHADKVRYIPPREETGEMTAYEVARRYQLAQKLLGPTYGNIIYHGLDRIIESTFDIMLSAGAFGVPPRPIKKATIQYESPLARSQRIQDVQAIEQTFQILAPMGQIYETVFDNFNGDRMAKRVAKELGFPADCLNTQDERSAIRDAREQAAQQAQTIETIEKGSKAAGNLAKIQPEQIRQLGVAK